MPTNESYVIITTFKAISSFIIFHILTTRLLAFFKIKYSRMLTIFIFHAIANIPVILFFNFCFSTFSKESFTVSMIFALTVFNCMAFFYVQFFNMSETARRIKLIIAIKNGKITNINEIESDYEPSVMLGKRLTRLIGLRQIKLGANGKFILINSFFLNVSKIFELWKCILGIKK